MGNDPTHGKLDQAEGKIKEAAGNVTNDDEMEVKGKAQHAKGAAKEAVHTVSTKGEDIIKDVRDNKYDDTEHG